MNEKYQEILQVHNNRYACKKFDEIKKISKDDFECILEAGRLSPSSFGLEPWKFLLIEDKNLKEELKEVSWGARNSLETASHFLIILARKDITANSSHIKHIMEGVRGIPLETVKRNQELFKSFQENDFNLLNSKDGLFDWASKQTYIALANMMTTASFLGIDSCPIEGFNRDSVNEILSSKNIMDLGIYSVSCMVSFGYRNEIQPIKIRQELNNIYEVI